jgi:ribosomal protein L40E
MNKLRFATVGLAVLLAVASSAMAQNHYIGYVYPAGGQQGTTFPIRLGGQGLNLMSGLVVTGEGVSVRLVDYYRVWGNQEMAFLSRQLNELRRKETKLSDPMVARMNWFEFPAPIAPPSGSESARFLICPVCRTANPMDAAVCDKCDSKLEKPREPKLSAKDVADEFSKSPQESAKQKLIERIQRRLAEDERTPAVRSQTELVFAEVTIAPNAAPGQREIRVVTRRGVSNPLPFCVGQVPEIARKPMKTCQLSVLGKEHLAQRKRPPEEVELRVKVPCTMNGQIAPGEMNRYRFQATKGQRLVISTKARELVPYVADAVPGWFQAVLRLRDAKGREVAYDDDFLFNPDPVIFFQVPEDGEYVLSINEALFRGRESFVYRITIGELPFVTSIFPLGARAGEPAKVAMKAWNLEGAELTLPSPDAEPGVYLVAAGKQGLVSNRVAFALDTPPESFENEPNNDPPHAQKVELPVIVNGRSDRPGDSDVFEVEGKAGETIVAEASARRLGSPYDSFVEVLSADGKIIALNDDHFDAASGLNTDHADSYLMVKLPADGKYFVRIGDTRRHAGEDHAYRLRISRPRPDFVLRLLPSRINMPSKGSGFVTVYAMRKDGFDGPIKLSFKNLPAGFDSPGAMLGGKQEVTRLPLRTSLKSLDMPVNVSVIGTAQVGDQEVVREAVPSEDKMQAFLWRHLLPADNLPVLVYDPSYQPPADRVRPPIRDEDRPKDVKPTLTRSSVEGYLRQIDSLYQEWLLTDEFVNREIANTEARVIKLVPLRSGS